MNSFGDVFDYKARKDDGEQNWDDPFNATCSILGGESPPHTSTEYERDAYDLAATVYRYNKQKDTLQDEIARIDGVLMAAEDEHYKLEQEIEMKQHRFGHLKNNIQAMFHPKNALIRRRDKLDKKKKSTVEEMDDLVPKWCRRVLYKTDSIDTQPKDFTQEDTQEEKHVNTVTDSFKNTCVYVDTGPHKRVIVDARVLALASFQNGIKEEFLMTKFHTKEDEKNFMEIKEAEYQKRKRNFFALHKSGGGEGGGVDAHEPVSFENPYGRNDKPPAKRTKKDWELKLYNYRLKM